MTHPRTVLLVASLAALLGACSSAPVTPAAPVAASAPAAPAKPVVVAAPAAAAPAAAPAASTAARALPPYLDPKSEIALKRSIFFDFDQQLIKPEFTAIVELHGKYLAGNPGVAIRLEGNADERGSPEYNLALGQRRAEAVRKALQLVGVKDAQLEAVSYGEEKPRASGHDEAAWAQNRRVDLVYPAK